MENLVHRKQKIPVSLLVVIMGSILLGMSSFKAIAQENVALYKPTNQTNIYQGGHSNRAVDGNTSGNWGDVSLSHTHGVNNPYWEVDLLDTYDISSIKIYNRTDCCPERLNNFTIRVSDRPIHDTNSGTVFNPGNKETFRDSKTFSGSARGRYVNISMEGNQILALAEVQVFGSLNTKNPNAGINLALGKKATQSDTYDYGSPQRANDGDTDGNWNNGSVSHTNGGNNRFWQVDLGESFGITNVQVFNRTDCCPERLNNFKIYVSDVPLGNTRFDKEQFLYATQKGTMNSQSENFTNKKVGQYVRIEMEGNSILSLAEVKVFGKKLGKLETGDFETVVRYNVSVFRNPNPPGTEPQSYGSERTFTISEGFDFNRTVNKTDESYWKLGSEVSTTFNIFGQGVDVTVNAEGGQNQANSVSNSQGGNVNESKSEKISLEQKVPGGCVRYEFYKWLFKQTPYTYNIDGVPYSWFRNNSSPEYLSDVTVFVFPADQVPTVLIEKLDKDKWLEKEDFDTLYNNYISYRVQN